MPFSRTGLRAITLYGPSGEISTAGLAVKSTGKPTSGVKMINLGAAYSRFGLQVSLASTVATSGFTVTLIGSLTSQNLGKVGSSKFSVLVSATSANLSAIKFSTSIIPATWIGVRSSKFTTAAGRSVHVRVCATPA